MDKYFLFAENSHKKYITVSYAVFYEEEGQEAPGVVVGFQFDYETLKKIVERVSFFFLSDALKQFSSLF